MATVSFRLREESTCSICLDYFTNPVKTDCEHSFCKACLTRSWRAQGRKTFCPLCREPAQEKDLQPNPKLADLVHITKLFSLREGAVCERHLQPLKLFCQDDKTPVCVACNQSKEHREHHLIPVEEAVRECKVKVRALLEDKRQIFEDQEKSEEQRSQVDLKRLEEKRQEITSAMEEVHRFLQEKERCWMRQLAGLEEETKRRQEENAKRRSQQILRLINCPSTSLIELLKSQEPPSEFQQHLGSTSSSCLKRKMTEELKPSPWLKWRLRSDTLKISGLRKAMQNLEGSLMESLNEVSVTLDPDTAHPELILSPDLKSVRRGKSDKNVPDNPERFDMMPCVLGRETFTSGKHYWEVEVEKLKRKEVWAVGVAHESLKRKGWIVLNDPKGIWAVRKNSLGPHKLAAFKRFPHPVGSIRVDLKGDPKKVRVFLDYEEGRVEFFDGDTDDVIFTFPPLSFDGSGVRPFFWVGSGVSLKMLNQDLYCNK